MQSIRGIYTGKEIKPLEDIHVRPNVRVIITFLDEAASDTEREYETESSQKSPIQEFLEKCDGWEDTRSVDAIVSEIYEARTTSERGADLFQEPS